MMDPALDDHGMAVEETLSILRSYRIGSTFAHPCEAQRGSPVDHDFISLDFTPFCCPRPLVATTTSCHTICLYCPDRAKVLVDLPNDKYGCGLLRFVPGSEGRTLVHTSWNSLHDNALRHLDWEKRRYLQYLGVGSRARVVSLNAAVERRDLLVTGSDDRSVRLWDVRIEEQEQIIHDIPIRRGVPFVEFGSAAHSRQSVLVAVGAGDEVGLRDLRKFSQGPFLRIRIPPPLSDPRVRESFIRNVRVSPDGKWLLVACADGLHVVDSYKGNIRWSRNERLACCGQPSVDGSFRRQAIDTVADFVPDSQHCLFGKTDGSVHIVETHSGRPVWSMDRLGVITDSENVRSDQRQQRKLIHRGPVMTLRHSPSMTLFVTGSRLLKFWVPVMRRFD